MCGPFTYSGKTMANRPSVKALNFFCTRLAGMTPALSAESDMAIAEGC